MCYSREAFGPSATTTPEEEYGMDVGMAVMLYKELVPRILVKELPDSLLGSSRVWDMYSSANKLRRQIANLKYKGLLDTYITIPLFKCTSTYARLAIFVGAVLVTHLVGCASQTND
jgi:hypothetical protein